VKKNTVGEAARSQFGGEEVEVEASGAITAIT
jgi:hypothetical protein